MLERNSGCERNLLRARRDQRRIKYPSPNKHRRRDRRRAERFNRPGAGNDDLIGVDAVVRWGQRDRRRGRDRPPDPPRRAR